MSDVNKEVEKAVTMYLKERGGQGLTNIMRSIEYGKKDVENALRRLKERKVVVSERSHGCNKKSVTWYLASNKAALDYRLATKKWDLNLFS